MGSDTIIGYQNYNKFSIWALIRVHCTNISQQQKTRGHSKSFFEWGEQLLFYKLFCQINIEIRGHLRSHEVIRRHFSNGEIKLNNFYFINFSVSLTLKFEVIRGHLRSHEVIWSHFQISRSNCTTCIL